MNEELILQCEKAAQEIVLRSKARWPGCEDAINISFGGGFGSSSQDTEFKRQGTGTTSNQRSLGATLAQLLAQNQGAATVDGPTAIKQQGFLSGLLDNPNSAVNPTLLRQVQAMDPTAFSGRSGLDNMAAIDPTSTAYETATNDAFTNRLNQAMAQARTGATNVRGGTARQGYREGEAAYLTSLARAEELRRAKLQDFSMVKGAVETNNAIEGSRRGQQLQGQAQEQAGVTQQRQTGLGAAQGIDQRWGINNANLALAAEMLGIKQQTTNEDLHGKGMQEGTNSASQFGVGCCFIFMEHFNGYLPWFVRESRDFFWTPTRQAGYTQMSKWLVPLMRKSKIVRSLVNLALVKPLTAYGGWFWKEPGYELGWITKPITYAWFKLWDLTAKGTYGR